MSAQKKEDLITAGRSAKLFLEGVATTAAARQSAAYGRNRVDKSNGVEVLIPESKIVSMVTGTLKKG